MTQNVTRSHTPTAGPVQRTSATFIGMPKFPKAAREALANTQQRKNLRHATHTIRDKRAAAVAEVPQWEALRVAGAEAKDEALTHLGDDAGGLVAEEERIVVADPALAVVEVGVADAAGLDVDDDLARSRVGDDDVGDLDRLPLRLRDNSLDCGGHEASRSRADARSMMCLSPV